MTPAAGFAAVEPLVDGQSCFYPPFRHNGIMALSGFTHAVNYRRLERATTSDTWTFAAWVYPTSAPADYAAVIESRDGTLEGLLTSGGGGTSQPWTLDYGANFFDRDTNLDAVLNTWQLVMGTVDASANPWNLAVYLGVVGGSKSSDTWTHGVASASETVTNWYQYDPDAIGRNFVGRVALAGIWDIALSESDFDNAFDNQLDLADIESANCRISNYFDDTQLSIDGATDGSSTYTDVGTLTTEDGPFTASTPTMTLLGVG